MSIALLFAPPAQVHLLHRHRVAEWENPCGAHSHIWSTPTNPLSFPKWFTASAITDFYGWSLAYTVVIFFFGERQHDWFGIWDDNHTSVSLIFWAMLISYVMFYQLWTSKLSVFDALFSSFSYVTMVFLQRGAVAKGGILVWQTRRSHNTLKNNGKSAKLRRLWPRHLHHPPGLLNVCPLKMSQTHRQKVNPYPWSSLFSDSPSQLRNNCHGSHTKRMLHRLDVCHPLLANDLMTTQEHVEYEVKIMIKIHSLVLSLHVRWTY